jgi:hypothetical protein
MTREHASKATGINYATLFRIETARTRPHMRTLATLLDRYEVDADEREQLNDLCRDASKQGWLRPYHSELPEEYTAYISFEDEAQGVRNYESLFVPGLLQTEEYTRAVVRGVAPSATEDEVEDRVRARMERQRILTRPTPVKLWAVLDEAALHRMVGGSDVMRAQLDRLVSAAKAPNITIQVIPFGAGAHPGMPGQFITLDFADPVDTDLIYIDSMAGDLFLESDADVVRYRDAFDNLVAIALSPKKSASFIAEICNKLKEGEHD